MGDIKLPSLQNSFTRLSHVLAKEGHRLQTLVAPSVQSDHVSLQLETILQHRIKWQDCNIPLSYNSPVYTSRYASSFLSNMIVLTHSCFAICNNRASSTKPSPGQEGHWVL